MALTLQRTHLNDADARLTAWLWGIANRDGSFGFKDGSARPITAQYVADTFGWGLTKAKAALRRAVQRGDLRRVGKVASGQGFANVYALDGVLLAAAKGSLRKAQVATATAAYRGEVAPATTVEPEQGSLERPKSVAYESPEAEPEVGVGEQLPGARVIRIEPTAGGDYHRVYFDDGREATVFHPAMAAQLKQLVGQRIEPVVERSGRWLRLVSFQTHADRRAAQLRELAEAAIYVGDSAAIEELVRVAREGDPALPDAALDDWVDGVLAAAGGHGFVEAVTAREALLGRTQSKAADQTR
jgi:hypothetical protein